jgi:hypothetical protein
MNGARPAHLPRIPVLLFASICAWLLVRLAARPAVAVPGASRSPPVFDANRPSPLDVLPSLCIISRVYYKHPPATLLAHVSSLVVGAPSDVRIILVRLFLERACGRSRAVGRDGAQADSDRHVQFTELPRIVARINQIFNREVVQISPRTFRALQQEFYPWFRDINDYGYVVADHVVEDILAERAQLAGKSPRPARLPCDTLLVTNAGRCFAPGMCCWTDACFGSRSNQQTTSTLPACSKKLCASCSVGLTWSGSTGSRITTTPRSCSFTGSTEEACAGASGRAGKGQPPGGVGLSCSLRAHTRYQEMTAGFLVFCIDLGAVVLRSDLLAVSGYRLLVDDLRRIGSGTMRRQDLHQDLQMASRDGLFFQQLAKFASNQTAAKVELLNEVMYFHQ